MAIRQLVVRTGQARVPPPDASCTTLRLEPGRPLASGVPRLRHGLRPDEAPPD